MAMYITGPDGYDEHGERLPDFIPVDDRERYIGHPLDYCGFHYAGYSSHDLGITRVSDGSRYSSSLMPTLEDKTVPVPGGHGYYFFGSYFRDRVITLNIAFDNITEYELRNLQTIFSPTTHLKNFYWDEYPYKLYRTKITQPIQITSLTFDEEPYERRNSDYPTSRRRIYKGEGTITLQCYNPFAQEKHKYLNEYKAKELGVSEEDLNEYINEWALGSRLLSSNREASGQLINEFEGMTCRIYNAGDIDSDFQLIVPLEDIENGSYCIYYWYTNDAEATDEDEGETDVRIYTDISYNDLSDKPSINNVKLQGNISSSDLGIAALTEEEREAIQQIISQDYKLTCHYLGECTYSELIRKHNNNIGDIWQCLETDGSLVKGGAFIWTGTNWTNVSWTDFNNGQIRGNISTAEIDEIFEIPQPEPEPEIKND